MKQIKIILVLALLLLIGLNIVIISIKKEILPIVTVEQQKPLSIPVKNPPTPEELHIGINKERAKVGVVPLILDPRLNESATIKAKDMLINGYGHIDPQGKHGYEYVWDYMQCYKTGENLGAAETAEEAVREWVASKPHYAALINSNYSLTGFGVAEISGYYYVVQHFCQL